MHWSFLFYIIKPDLLSDGYFLQIMERVSGINPPFQETFNDVFIKKKKKIAESNLSR